MSDINIKRNSKLIQCLASQARNERVDSGDVEQSAKIITELAQDLNNQHNREQIANVVAYTVDELQKTELDFLNQMADIKNINVGDKAMFQIQNGGIKAFYQAKGSTTARSFVSDKQVTLDTQEISARPAIHIWDARAGRLNMADLLRDANREITNKKIEKIESVLHDAIDNYASPFYGTGTGIVPATLDAQIAYFSRFGAVNIIGDAAAVQQLAGLTGMQMDSSTKQFSDALINEYNDNGFIGRYKGCNVIKMANAYKPGSTSPILASNWLYIVPAGLAATARNLKVVNEGGIWTVENQNIDDLVFEVRIDTW